MHGSRAHGRLRSGIAWALAPLLASVAAAGLVVGTVDPVLSIPAKWPLLALVAAVSTGVLVVFARRDRLIEPLPLVMLVLLAVFAARALQLMLAPEDLLRYRPSSGDLSTGLSLSSQEIAVYVTRKLTVAPDTAVARTLAALLLFAVAVLAGYRSGAGRALAARLRSVGRGSDHLHMGVAIAVLMGVGLLGQAAIYARIGGPLAALGDILSQANLQVPFLYLTAAGFTTVGLVLWYVWHTPTSSAARFGYAAAVAETVGFWATTGSRTHALTPLFVVFLARHFVRRPWTLAQIAVIGGVLTLLASTYLVVRQATYSSSLGQALQDAPRYALDPSATLFDNTTFDDLFAAVNTYGASEPHAHGGAVVDAVRSFVPQRIDPERPQGTDIEFRRLILGDNFQGGRPYSVVGDFYRDFGFAGVLAGALLLGILVRGLAGLGDRTGPREGRRLRIVLFVFGMLILYQLLVGAYSITIGDLIEIGTPLTLALVVFARPTRARTG